MNGPNSQSRVYEWGGFSDVGPHIHTIMTPKIPPRVFCHSIPTASVFCFSVQLMHVMNITRNLVYRSFCTTTPFFFNRLHTFQSVKLISHKVLCNSGIYTYDLFLAKCQLLYMCLRHPLQLLILHSVKSISCLVLHRTMIWLWLDKMI